MEERLYLNGLLVDLPKNEKISRKIQIGEIGDISVRKSSFSYTFKLPNTSKNLKILDFLAVKGNRSRKPYSKIIANYIVEGIPIVSNGYAVIKDFNGDFGINIYDGLIDLSERLKGKKITDLNLLDLNHFINSQTYIDSYENNEGYIYGIAEYGKGNASLSSLQVEKQAPSIYLHTIFKRIFDEAGLVLTGSFFDLNESFLNEVITPSKGFDVLDVQPTKESKGGFDLERIFEFSQSQTFISKVIVFDLTDIDLSIGNVNADNIEITEDGNFTFNIGLNYRKFNCYCVLRLVINNLIRYSEILQDSNFDILIEKEINLNLKNGDSIRFEVNMVSLVREEDGNNGSIDDLYEINFSGSGNVNITKNTGGQIIEPVKYLSEINQIDIVKDVLQRYGLILHPVKNSNNYRFRQIENILTDRGGAEDWSSKFIGLESEEYQTSYAKRNLAQYTYPEDTVIPNNDGLFELENENLEAEKTIFKSFFEVPVFNKNISGEKTYKIPIWSIEDLEVNNEETPAKIMKIKRVSATVNARFFNEASPVSKSGNIPFLSLEETSMNYYLSNYYRAFKALMNRYNKKKITLNLSPIDIFELDFFKLKYFKQTSSFLYLDSINYRAGDKAEAEFYEIEEFVSNLPPSNIGDLEFNLNSGSQRNVSKSQLMQYFFDPEENKPLNLKIVSGFNSDVSILNNGIEITEETEINWSDVNISFRENVSGTEAYVKEFEFNISDEGSKQYAAQNGSITMNVMQVENFPPVADAGEDYNKEIPVDQYYTNTLLNGSGSYDNTGSIIYYEWELISKPPNAEANIGAPGQGESPNNYLRVKNENNSIGGYTIRLTVTDQYGLTDTDTVSINITGNIISQ